MQPAARRADRLLAGERAAIFFMRPRRARPDLRGEARPTAAGMARGSEDPPEPRGAGCRRTRREPAPGSAGFTDGGRVPGAGEAAWGATTRRGKGGGAREAREGGVSASCDIP